MSYDIFDIYEHILVKDDILITMFLRILKLNAFCLTVVFLQFYNMVAKYGVLLLLLKSLMLIFSNKICSKILILWKDSIFVFVSKFWELIPSHPINESCL